MDSADYNFAHSIGVFASTSKTGEALEARDFVLGNSKAPIAEFNQAFLKQPDYKLARTLERVLAYYGRAGVPFRVHLASEQAAAAQELMARGFTEAPSIPCMVLPDARCAPFPVSDLAVRQASDPQTLRAFQTVAFESFGYPVEMAALALTEDLMRLPHVALFVGYLGAEPACCSALLVTNDMAGVYWVGTPPRFRQRGLGAAITAHAVAAGRRRGCRQACLQASPMGAPVYQRMGFVECRTYLAFEHAAGQTANGASQARVG